MERALESPTRIPVRAGEMAQSVEHRPCKPKALSSISRTHVKMPDMMANIVIPSPRDGGRRILQAHWRAGLIGEF